MAGSKTPDAGELARALSAVTGAPVELRWDSSSASRGRSGTWAWHVDWSDGPTVKAMRAHVEREIPLRRISAITGGDLVYARILQATSFAIVMVRNVRLGTVAAGRSRDRLAAAERARRNQLPRACRGRGPRAGGRARGPRQPCRGRNAGAAEPVRAGRSAGRDSPTTQRAAVPAPRRKVRPMTATGFNGARCFCLANANLRSTPSLSRRSRLITGD